MEEEKILANLSKIGWIPIILHIILQPHTIINQTVESKDSTELLEKV